MNLLERRKFVIASGVVGAGALAAGAGTFGLRQLLAAVDKTADAGTTASRLVLVTLYGGNDGLNTVIPYADPLYRSLRPELAYAPEDVLPLNHELGLNPVLTGLKQLWDRDLMAIVLGVGYPKPDRSHFRSMDIWQTASPVEAIATGWIGRWLDGTNASAETAVSLEPVLPPLLAGETRAGGCVAIGGLKLPQGITPELVSHLGDGARGEPGLQAKAAVAFHDLLAVDDLVRNASDDDDRSARPQIAVPGTDTGGESTLATQLALVGRCIEAGVPTRVYSVSLGGFDTHAKERAGHEALLKQLNSALTAFVDRMTKTERGRGTVVVVYSEFGRRVHANASEGTDHGTAGPVLVLGSGVKAGLYGHQPDLKDLDDGDLRMNVDFRDVYGTLLSTVLGAEPERYLPGYKARTLPFLVAP